MKLATYEDWKHCITVLCEIPLTAEYIDTRILALKDPNDYQTRKFKSTWGEAHLAQVISWFERAAKEVSA